MERLVNNNMEKNVMTYYSHLEYPAQVKNSIDADKVVKSTMEKVSKHVWRIIGWNANNDLCDIMEMGTVEFHHSSKRFLKKIFRKNHNFTGKIIETKKG